MPKIVAFTRKSPPSVPGFSDPVSIIDGIGNVIYTNAQGRTTPNSVKPSSSAAWDLAYGCVALGEYQGQIVVHEKHGKCILINKGKEIPAILPNVNHSFRYVVSEIFVHESDSETWPGSAGCLTIKKSEWLGFINHFSVGENVRIDIRGLS